MYTNREIFDFLNEKYPVDTACDFDNPGFLVGDGAAQTAGVLTALDCDAAALEAAVQNGCNLIVSHHPVIFEPLKAVTVESVIYALIRAGVSVISMHTNLDIGAGGVADCLCAAAGFENPEVYHAADGFALRRVRISPCEAPELARRLRQTLGGAVRYTDGGRAIEKILVCPGGGGGYVDEAVRGGFDALVTGDVKHNQLVQAANAGLSLFDAGHFATEDTVVEPLAALLRRRFRKLPVFTYHSDRLHWAE